MSWATKAAMASWMNDTTAPIAARTSSMSAEKRITPSWV